MAGRQTCPGCGSTDLVQDALYAQSQLVCAACGRVLAEGLLTTTFAEEQQLHEVTYSWSTGQKEQLSRCEQRGIRRVQDLCKVLQLPPVFEETAVSYFQRAIKHPSFHLVSLEKKEVLVGCCVCVTCRQHNWPVTMGTICSLLYADKELFTSVYLHVLKELELDVPALSLMDLVKTHLNGFKLFQSSTTVPAKFVEDKEKMVARTMQLVELASKTWLVTGRHPIPIVTAAAYLAWQSLQPGGRLTCTFSRFCKLADTDLPPPAHLRLKELQEILLRMASQLAWLQVLRVDKKTVVKHIGDLLQHRSFLLRCSFRAGDAEDGGEEAEGANGSSSPQAVESAGQPEGHSTAGTRRSAQTPLLPPCLLHPKKRPRAASPDPSAPDVTGDEPIPDSEIEQYLWSQEEIDALSQARAWQ
ncbi:PREDICTED: transcription factor IIIB 50 kDa subunit [Gavialis gangeticus]|uniref:transcription factor IIIB 50 kDa subunit n=1 Tax=Gavialis gangeticus TaxID=94835 RepID=UPI00092E265C|nr:PREDICTED: transcription factor IIIB 50 kDa subunit [Gavialis gangeticus]